MADPTGITKTPDGTPTGITEAPTPAPALDGAAAHKPYIPDLTRLKELTPSAVILGTSLGLIFAASSLYLVLKVGMTVSASIPVAVLAITLFRGLSRMFGLRRATILENNIVQTSGSAGESIAFGVGVTMPALLFLGFQMDLARVMVVSILGGLLGILAMIPLRRAFIVRMHGRPGQPGTLLYPEGVAAAQVLISGEKGGTTGATVFIGFGIAFVHKFLQLGLNVIKETVTVPLQAINRAAMFAGDMASELLGVGCIIGARTSAVMMAGAVLGYLVIIPIIFFIGEHAPAAIPPSTEKPISAMSISEIRNNYLLYIGAGCVAAAGLISMGRTLPMIVRSVRSGLATVRGAGAKGDGTARRTENDLSMRVVLAGSLGLLVLLALFLVTEVGIISAILGALLVLLFGFLFVTVSARLTGEIGSSSNPISGMT
ncbi:MAG TPA: oligopeptide transporter, OPT family, partial [Gemmataceae bacterium]|nr:oligopeptide transporter, OPT family [Gemmataceae bacterium]